jgi:transmembrane sensor
MKSPAQIEEQAAAWLAHRDSDQWTDTDAAGLAQWLEASTANRVAYLRLESVWETTHRLKALGAGLSQSTVPAPGGWQDSPFFEDSSRDAPSLRDPSLANTQATRPWRRFLAIAATVVIAVAVSAYFKLSSPGDRYSTPIGGSASLPLQDGSNLTLNTASKIRVELSANERRIDLDKGEAFFEVAKDKSRPFVVHVGNVRVIAVGTKFSVLRDGDDVRVVVTEGTVRLEASRTSSTIESTSLSAGAIARTRGEDVVLQTASVPQAEDILSWRQGYLTFHDTPLADAVREFNRYNSHRITISDPSVADIRISGTFRPTNYQAFVRLLESGFSLRAETAAETTVLSK